MELYAFGSLTILSFLGFSYYKGYITPLLDWTATQWKRSKIAYQLFKQLNTESEKGPCKPSVTVNDAGTCIAIEYNYFGNPFKVHVPYDRRYVSAMCMLRAELIRDGKVICDITQQSGIPYLINPEDLGGNIIRITDDETGKVSEYCGPPGYGLNLMWSEDDNTGSL